MYLITVIEPNGEITCVSYKTLKDAKNDYAIDIEMESGSFFCWRKGVLVILSKIVTSNKTDNDIFDRI